MTYVKLIYAEVAVINDGYLNYIPVILLSSNHPKRLKLCHPKKDSNIAILECFFMHECFAVLDICIMLLLGGEIGSWHVYFVLDLLLCCPSPNVLPFENFSQKMNFMGFLLEEYI